MIKDILEYNGKKYQLITAKLSDFLETMIFPIENDVISGKEVYCFRTTEPGLSINKHEDIYDHPEKYLSEVAIQEYIKSKENDFENHKDNKIYIVHGYINEFGDTDTWVREIFENEEQANCCAAYLNLTKEQENVTYYVSEYDGFCKDDYSSMLDKLLERKGGVKANDRKTK